MTDASNSKAVKVSMDLLEGTMTLLPPAAHLCQTCAREHDDSFPHDATTLYYQTRFNMDHGRAATWADAMEHCDDDMKRQWGEQLTAMNIDWQNGGLLPGLPAPDA